MGEVEVLVFGKGLEEDEGEEVVVEEIDDVIVLKVVVEVEEVKEVKEVENVVEVVLVEVLEVVNVEEEVVVALTVGLVVVVMEMVVSGWDLSIPPMRSLTDWMTLSTRASWTLSTGYLGVLAGGGEEVRQVVSF